MKLQCSNRPNNRKVYTLAIPTSIIEELNLKKGTEISCFTLVKDEVKKIVLVVEENRNY